MHLPANSPLSGWGCEIWRSMKPDTDHFKDFDPSLTEAMQRETELLFLHILRDNRPVAELLTADYTFLNTPLAKHYGVKHESKEFQRVSLACNAPTWNPDTRQYPDAVQQSQSNVAGQTREVDPGKCFGNSAAGTTRPVCRNWKKRRPPVKPQRFVNSWNCIVKIRHVLLVIV